MSLSSELLSQFVKITNDKPKSKSESTVYGTTVIHNGRTYVKLDGSDSDVLTPVSATASSQDGERVTVSIKDHTATITGNISSPSVRTGDLEDTKTTITKLDHVVATKASLDDLEVERARIDAIVAGDVTVNGTLEANVADIVALKAENALIQEKLTATEADVDKLHADKLDASVATATYATIENLEATNGDVYNLEVTYGNFETATTNKFTAVDASIADLEADKLDVNTASITYAKIADLNAMNADISNLEAEVADIDTLIFGSASGSTIQTSFANAVIAQLGNAQIKSAMIENVSADKIKAGDIITNNVRVKSQNGLLLISDETIQISDNSRVRVQIGKDASNDYSISIWDAEGNLMFSKGGITDSAIKDAIIRNDMVSDTANIAAHKLDIDSLFEEINGSTKTIKSTQIYLDDEKQTLDVAFKTLETEVDGLGTTVSSQGTQLSVIQGQIASKVWQQDIDSATGEMTTQYSVVEQQIDSINTTIASHDTRIANKADSSTVTTVNNRVTSLETKLTGFQSSVSTTYATKTEVEEIEVGGRNYVLSSDAEVTVKSYYALYKLSDAKSALEGEHVIVSFDAKRPEDGSAVDIYAYFRGTAPLTPNSNKIGDVTAEYKRYYVNIEPGVVIDDATHIAIHAGINASGISVKNVKVEIGTLPTDWTPAPEDVETDISELSDRMSDAETSIIQNSNAINLRATKTEVETAKTEAISSANSNTETLLEFYSTTSEMEAAIKLESNSITSSVSATYATITALSNTDDNVAIAQSAAEAAQNSVDNLSVGGRNYLKNSDYERECARGTVDFNFVMDLDWLKSMEGETVVFSFDGKGNEECSYQIDAYFRGDATTFNAANPIHTLGIEYARYSQIMSVPAIPDDDSVVMIRIRGNQYVGNGTNVGNFYIKNAKLEFGNKPTDWCPALEDIASAKDNELAQSTADKAQATATNAETLVQQLSDSISMLVTDGNGTSLMTQTEDGWTFSTADIHTAIASTAENLDALNNELGNTNNTVEVLQQAVADLGEIAEYVKIGTYEGEPCIELGEGDSEFKLRITNTRILFMEGSSVIAHFTNQSLHIKKAVIEEELQQGEFVWKVRSNGNLGLIWKGVTS